ncbi:hypothetical protein [Notoacmeibacter sp. MSK16QG-6]|uniref:hypothetical protein n=1 Tax=Notoacmeibacter sp. MSK16QG-6 TaxID=2957982 RepID=UPI00209F4571|nr:hypothetical protein [Notoacmeibacter sp. MSK16QG-6]MCP1200045.1 hypothetical protein [Notoacmeibacter sp. MSK16QG-6]
MAINSGVATGNVPAALGNAVVSSVLVNLSVGGRDATARVSLENLKAVLDGADLPEISLTAGNFGIIPNVTGTLADRSNYDDQAEGFVYLATDQSPFLFSIRDDSQPGGWIEQPDVVALGNAAKDAAEEWANNDEDDPVSVAAGGDGVSDFSAKHHSLKSEGYAATALAVTGLLRLANVSTFLSDNNSLFSYSGGGGATEVSAGAPFVFLDGGFMFEVVAPAATEFDIQSAGGVKVKYVSGGFVGDAEGKVRFVAGIFRQDSQNSGWYVLDNANHTPIGLDPDTPVEEVDGDIKLNYAFTAEKVLSLVFTPDEGYGNTELTFGASVGKSSALLSLYHPFWIRTSGTGAVSHSYFGTKGGDWDAVNDAAAGTWTVTHPTETHNDASGSVVAIEKYGEDTGIDDWKTISRTKGGFVIGARQPIAGKTNGASVLSDNVGPQTVSWDGVSTMTITHPTCASSYGASVTSTNPRYHAAVTNSGKTSITVQFYDVSTGALYSGASAPANVQYSRNSMAATSLTGGGKFKAERLGRCKVDAANVADASSNIWFFGAFLIAP